MDRANFFIYMSLMQFIIVSIIFFLSGELIAIIFLVLFICIDVSTLLFDFMDTRNREVARETQRQIMEALDYSRQVKQGKSDIQLLREELALLLEKEHVQIINKPIPPLIEVKPEEGEYRIIKK